MTTMDSKWLINNNSIEDEIRLFWFSSRMNFGDLLSPLIVSVLSGKKVHEVIPMSDSRPCLLALGSIFQFARNGDMIWGTGFRDDYPVMARQLDIKAIRGPLTRKSLIKLGIECPEIYGDPAILLPYLFRPLVVKERFRVGIVKHYSDKTSFEKFKNQDLIEINVQQDALKVVQEICSCEVILSSSLHGLIIAESYHIPACWLGPKNDLWSKPEPGMKYHDYYLSTLRDPEVYNYSQDSLDIDMAIKVALDSKKPAFDCNPLLMSFPFLRSEITSIKDLHTFAIGENAI
ncbi:MAG: polysaccharide pyruvyl transferase family protein [Candidatus Omnitrophica bacterium]|nr:polysaccharide pyruvyl transferase family protein [Candidatus Omnitrophota bacterium]